MDPYENIVIGNFLYAFGFLVGKKTPGEARSMSINLMQQTPLDQRLGDVLIGNSGVTRLIEFKRTSNDSTKEQSKHVLLSRSLDSCPHLVPVSRDIHWYIETSENREDFVSRVVPYLDFPSEKVGAQNMATFTSTTAHDAVERDIDDNTARSYREYMSLVACCHGGLLGGSGGLIVNYSEDKGLRYVMVPDIRDLLLHDRLVREAYLNRVQQTTLEHAREAAVREMEREISPQYNKGRGMSIGR